MKSQTQAPDLSAPTHCSPSVADYYAVYVKRDPKDRGNFLTNVMAKGAKDAIRIARDHGHKLPRWSFALHIGREGYFRALASAFPNNTLKK